MIGQYNDRRAKVLEISKQLETEGLTSEHLDQLVSDAAAEIASATNNDGLGSQVSYLLNHGNWTFDDILFQARESKERASLPKYPEFARLSEFLKDLDLIDAYPISFEEEHEADNRFALRVGVENRNGQPELLRKLAAFWGCPEDELPEAGCDSFEASDSWHCLGEGNLRDLADQIAKDQGEGFFDCVYTVGEIHKLAEEVGA